MRQRCTTNSLAALPCAPPLENEPALKVSLNKTKTNGQFGISGLLSIIGTEVAKVKGRYEVSLKDNLLIIQLRK